MKIYKLIPATKSYIWGGRRLIEEYGKKCSGDTLAETWELSFHPDGMTRTEDGKFIDDSIPLVAIGKGVNPINFPQLIKLIDAHDNLSVQVHPTDADAFPFSGKTEMWHIVDAQEGAGIYLGFKEDVTKEQLVAAIDNNTITDLLNFFEVKKGETYYIPAGTVHAIGKGCLICEVQQNSNITYRVYDYDRRDKDGNPRELHVEKALKVANLKKYVHSPLKGKTVARSKYFSVDRFNVDGEMTVNVDKNSFKYFICLEGEGTLGDRQVKAGESYFIPAGYGDVRLSGEMSVLTSETRSYYIGIDLGGTFIKGGVVDDIGNVISSSKIPTEADKGQNQVVENIDKLCRIVCQSAQICFSDIIGIGVAVPGTVDSDSGTVVYSNNLDWNDVKLADKLTACTDLPVKIANDANTAALGEALFGSGKKYKTTVMLTLGTGVGGGVVIDGKLYDGNRGAGAEMGHAVIMMDGEQCTCGRRGCLEAYASATALIRDTKRAMLANPDSKMHHDKTVDGATAFNYMEVDSAAKTVVDNYIKYLACGITNLANEFRPEAVILGGGICNEGERLIRPLQSIVDRDIFGGKKSPEVKIITATLGNSAGLVGAAALCMEEN